MPVKKCIVRLKLDTYIIKWIILYVINLQKETNNIQRSQRRCKERTNRLNLKGNTTSKRSLCPIMNR